MEHAITPGLNDAKGLLGLQSLEANSSKPRVHCEVSSSLKKRRSLCTAPPQHLAQD